jgi:predicted glutamine amidotransferase
MCGLAGGFTNISSSKEASSFSQNLKNLLRLSSLRGQDAAGVALFSDTKTELIKALQPGTLMSRTDSFKKTLQNFFSGLSGPTAFLIHCRLSTSGHLTEEHTQPLEWPGFTGIHNGIVLQLGEKRLDPTSYIGKSDSHQLFEQFQQLLDQPSQPIEAFRNLVSTVVGEANLALYLKKPKQFLLSTNTGSLFYYFNGEQRCFYFMSEKFALETFLESAGIGTSLNIQQLAPGTLLSVFPEQGLIEFHKINIQKRQSLLPSSDETQKAAGPQKNHAAIPTLKRCTCCILPETYPFISFDEKGVCNFCRRYQKQVQHGEEALLKYLEPFRSVIGKPDCLVGLSGGRDSSYGLHLLKTKYGMNPVAYTFDWGLTTETSRRNQSLMCSALGVEHIIRAANLTQKRSYIQKNVNAFLRRPHLGMVPIFMSGDKEFYEYGRTLKKETGVNLTVFCAGHSLEQRDFFTGFCGVDENIANNKRLFHFTFQNKLKLAAFYATQYILNPAYFNQSFSDSLKSFIYSFIYRDDFLYLYEYVPWNEAEIEKTLAQYGWEHDTAYGRNQWRMGDGQTAFTNYIYLSVAGFSEFDNYRSNQIREGMISRDEALKAVVEDNRTKEDSLKYFAEVTGIDLEKVLKKIDQIPKLYAN